MHASGFLISASQCCFARRSWEDARARPALVLPTVRLQPVIPIFLHGDVTAKMEETADRNFSSESDPSGIVCLWRGIFVFPQNVPVSTLACHPLRLTSIRQSIHPSFLPASQPSSQPCPWAGDSSTKAPETSLRVAWFGLPVLGYTA